MIRKALFFQHRPPRILGIGLFALIEERPHISFIPVQEEIVQFLVSLPN